MGVRKKRHLANYTMMIARTVCAQDPYQTTDMVADLVSFATSGDSDSVSCVKESLLALNGNMAKPVP